MNPSSGDQHDILSQDADLTPMVLNSINEGVVVANEHGQFVFWNPAATAIIGMGADDVPPEQWSKHYHVLVPDEDTPFPAERLPLVRAIHGEDVDNTELLISNPQTAKRVLINCNARPIRNEFGHLVGGVLFFHDVTERRRIERELREFARSVSHDLKSPLTTILGFTETLAKLLGSNPKPQVAECLDEIRAGAQRMTRLIADLLAHSQAGQSWRLEQVDMAEVVFGALANLRADIDARQAEVRIDGALPTVAGDRTGLQQVMQNLIGNALKFVAPGVTPDVHIGCIEGGKSWRIYVRDNGIGIDPKYARRIFDVFRRLHAQGDYAGTGIGLSIVKKVAELHGGGIVLEPNPDGGSTFWLQLPKKRAT